MMPYEPSSLILLLKNMQQKVPPIGLDVLCQPFCDDSYSLQIGTDDALQGGTLVALASKKNREKVNYH